MALLKKFALAATLSLAMPGLAEAAWLRAESPHFIVYGEGSEAALRTRVLELEDFDQLLRSVTGTSDRPGRKLVVYLIRGYDQLRQIWPAATSQVGGFYTATPEGVFAVADTDMGASAISADEVLFHEYAHHFMLQYFPGAYPAWYTEGFAEYLMTVRFDAETIELGRRNSGRERYLGSHIEMLPLDQLLFGDPSQLNEGQTAQFYAQSWLLIHFLFRDPERSRQLSRYLVALGEGRDPRNAFAEAFGTGPQEVQRRLNDYFRRGTSFSRIRRRSVVAPPGIGIARLPPSADDLLFLDIAMRRSAQGEGDLLLRRVRRAAAGRSDDFARRVLARAEATYGEGAAAERLLGALLETAPADAELLYLMGVRHLAAGRVDAANRSAHFGAAQGWLGRAVQADAMHAPALFRLAESLSADPAASDRAIDYLLQAHRVAPQISAITLAAARMLLRRERWAEAEALLTPLASDAHRGASARAARDLLAKARARDNGGIPDAFEPPARKDDGP